MNDSPTLQGPNSEELHLNNRSSVSSKRLLDNQTKSVEWFLGIKHVCRIATMLEQHFWDVQVAGVWDEDVERISVWIHGYELHPSIAADLLGRLQEESELAPRTYGV